MSDVLAAIAGGRGPLSGEPARPVRPDNLGVEPGRLVVLPPEFSPPRGAEIVDDITQATAVAPLATLVIYTRQIPDGGNFRIEFIGFDANDPSAFGNCTFAFKTKGNAIQGYGLVSVSIGTVQKPGLVHPVITGPNTLALEVTNNSLGTLFTLQARVTGWVWTPQ